MLKLPPFSSRSNVHATCYRPLALMKHLLPVSLEKAFIWRHVVWVYCFCTCGRVWWLWMRTDPLRADGPWRSGTRH